MSARKVLQSKCREPGLSQTGSSADLEKRIEFAENKARAQDAAEAAEASSSSPSNFYDVYAILVKTINVPLSSDVDEVCSAKLATEAQCQQQG